MSGPAFIEEDFGPIIMGDGEFAEPVLITFKGNQFNTNGIFDETFLEYDADGNLVNSKFSRVTFEDNVLFDLLGEEITDSEQDQLTFLIRGETFKGFEPNRDGTGLIMFKLKKD